jgi:predicted RNA-binding Zn-ribbon protein involved in translation (DUF1610 family)
MVATTRYCPDCGWDRPFEQHHPIEGNCPDSHDGWCSEWSCADCGAAMVVGLAICRGDLAQAPDAASGRRVA